MHDIRLLTIVNDDGCTWRTYLVLVLDCAFVPNETDQTRLQK